jgi:hypothetical protein
MSVVSVNVRILEPHGDIGQTQPLPRASIAPTADCGSVSLLMVFDRCLERHIFKNCVGVANQDSVDVSAAHCATTMASIIPEEVMAASKASGLYFTALATSAWYSGSRGISSQRGTIRCDGMMKAKQLYSNDMHINVAREAHGNELKTIRL